LKVKLEKQGKRISSLNNLIIILKRLSKKVKFIEKLILKGVVAIHELPLQLLVIFMDIR